MRENTKKDLTNSRGGVVGYLESRFGGGRRCRALRHSSVIWLYVMGYLSVVGWPGGKVQGKMEMGNWKSSARRKCKFAL